MRAAVRAAVTGVEPAAVAAPAGRLSRRAGG